VREGLRVVVAGAGRAGLVHARNLAAGIAGASLAAVADPDAEARERAATELDCKAFNDPVAAATSDDVDAVVVASPTPTHAEIAVAALEAGKHVLCEKPLASTLEQARTIVEAAGRSSGSFAMGFMRRFDDQFVRARERIDAGEIGEPILVRSTGRGPGLPGGWALDPRLSGGLIAEVNSHDIDTVRWLSDREFESVYAAGRAAKRPDLAEEHPGFVDVLAVTAVLTDGGLAQIDGACPAGYGYDARVEVYGSEGTLLVGDPRARSAVVVRADGAVVDPVSSWRTLFAEAYRAEVGHLARVARGEAEPRAGALDGLRALEVVVAVNRSMQAGNVVRIAPDGA
jgi:myo-inositol 2-dehydrogenase/D-chiro-inositol 1-dehydrogenase/scyllo-inositol 2-dehydrogenase (NAD+)